MRTDFYSGNFVGKAEDAAVHILSDLFKLEVKNRENFYKREDGIYTQIDIPDLLNEEQLKDLAHYHHKSSVDIVILGKLETPLCIRVQGRSHYKSGPKPRRDSVQAILLRESGNEVVDFPYYEMPELFKDLINQKSINEVKAILKLSGIES